VSVAKTARPTIRGLGRMGTLQHYPVVVEAGLRARRARDCGGYQCDLQAGRKGEEQEGPDPTGRSDEHIWTLLRGAVAGASAAFRIVQFAGPRL
jgi:hypothetical protein